MESVEKKSLTQESSFVRNIVVLAHIDHGKTTLVDSLLAYEGSIPINQMGQMRYLDSREEEQERGITIKSSSALFHYKPNQSRLYGNVDTSQEYSIHLIDSPGHIDFYGQVLYSSKIADGALILIDALEGICPQTLTALSLSHEEGLTPILFINKIDKLIVEMELGPGEAYSMLFNIIESVNAECGLFRSACEDGGSEYLSNMYFDPRKRNVIFGSAIDFWAFRPLSFLNIYEKKLGIPRQELNKGIWGNYTTESGKVKKFSGNEKEPLFVKLILRNIWKVYNSALIEYDEHSLTKILTKMKMNIDFRSYTDKRRLLRSIMMRWMFSAQTVFDSFVDCVPSPNKSHNKRMASIRDSVDRDSTVIDLVNILPMHYFNIHEDISESSVDRNISLARIYQGSLTLGDHVHLYHYSPDNNSCEFIRNKIENVKVDGLYKVMGSELTPIKEVTEGHIFAIDTSILKNAIFKCGTLVKCSRECENINVLDSHSSRLSSALLKVSIEPLDLENIDSLQVSLTKLYRTDPSLQIRFMDSGELIMETCGNLHLESCIRELKHKYVDFEFKVSDPIVTYRETISGLYSVSPLSYIYSKSIMEIKARTYGKTKESMAMCSVCVDPATNREFVVIFVLRSGRLPETIVDYISNHTEIDVDADQQKELLRLLHNEKDWTRFSGCIANVGPPNNRSNLLAIEIDNMEGVIMDLKTNRNRRFSGFLLKEWEKQILDGFNRAVESGPLCGEQLSKVFFIIEKVYLYDSDVFQGNADSLETKTLEHMILGNIPDTPSSVPNIGMIISIIRDFFHRSFLSWSPRLMIAVNLVELRIPQNFMGKALKIVNRHGGRVIESVFNKDMGSFIVKSNIPVVNSARFVESIRSETSGHAFPSLQFGGYYEMEEDPYWCPSNTEEIEQFGDVSVRNNLPLTHILDVRKKKVSLLMNR